MRNPCCSTVTLAHVLYVVGGVLAVYWFFGDSYSPDGSYPGGKGGSRGGDASADGSGGAADKKSKSHNAILAGKAWQEIKDLGLVKFHVASPAQRPRSTSAGSPSPSSSSEVQDDFYSASADHGEAGDLQQNEIVDGGGNFAFTVLDFENGNFGLGAVRVKWPDRYYDSTPGNAKANGYEAGAGEHTARFSADGTQMEIDMGGGGGGVRGSEVQEKDAPFAQQNSVEARALRLYRQLDLEEEKRLRSAEIMMQVSREYAIFFDPDEQKTAVSTDSSSTATGFDFFQHFNDSEHASIAQLAAMFWGSTDHTAGIGRKKNIGYRGEEGADAESELDINDSEDGEEEEQFVVSDREDHHVIQHPDGSIATRARGGATSTGGGQQNTNTNAGGGPTTSTTSGENKSNDLYNLPAHLRRQTPRQHMRSLSKLRDILLPILPKLGAQRERGIFAIDREEFRTIAGGTSMETWQVEAFKTTDLIHNGLQTFELYKNITMEHVRWAYLVWKQHSVEVVRSRDIVGGEVVVSASRGSRGDVVSDVNVRAPGSLRAFLAPLVFIRPNLHGNVQVVTSSLPDVEEDQHPVGKVAATSSSTTALAAAVLDGSGTRDSSAGVEAEEEHVFSSTKSTSAFVVSSQTVEDQYVKAAASQRNREKRAAVASERARKTSTQQRLSEILAAEERAKQAQLQAEVRRNETKTLLNLIAAQKKYDPGYFTVQLASRTAAYSVAQEQPQAFELFWERRELTDAAALCWHGVWFTKKHRMFVALNLPSNATDFWNIAADAIAAEGGEKESRAGASLKDAAGGEGEGAAGAGEKKPSSSEEKRNGNYASKDKTDGSQLREEMDHAAAASSSSRTDAGESGSSGEEKDKLRLSPAGSKMDPDREEDVSAMAPSGSSKIDGSSATTNKNKKRSKKSKKDEMNRNEEKEQEVVANKAVKHKKPSKFETRTGRRWETTLQGLLIKAEAVNLLQKHCHLQIPAENLQRLASRIAALSASGTADGYQPGDANTSKSASASSTSSSSLKPAQAQDGTTLLHGIDADASSSGSGQSLSSADDVDASGSSSLGENSDPENNSTSTRNQPGGTSAHPASSSSTTPDVDSSSVQSPPSSESRPSKPTTWGFYMASSQEPYPGSGPAPLLHNANGAPLTSSNPRVQQQLSYRQHLHRQGLVSHLTAQANARTIGAGLSADAKKDATASERNGIWVRTSDWSDFAEKLEKEEQLEQEFRLSSFQGEHYQLDHSHSEESFSIRTMLGCLRPIMFPHKIFFSEMEQLLTTGGGKGKGHRNGNGGSQKLKFGGNKYSKYKNYFVNFPENVKPLDSKSESQVFLAAAGLIQEKLEEMLVSNKRIRTKYQAEYVAKRPTSKVREAETILIVTLLKSLNDAALLSENLDLMDSLMQPYKGKVVERSRELAYLYQNKMEHEKSVLQKVKAQIGRDAEVLNDGVPEAFADDQPLDPRFHLLDPSFANAIATET
eukprot:g10507.t1